MRRALCGKLLDIPRPHGVPHAQAACTWPGFSCGPLGGGPCFAEHDSSVWASFPTVSKPRAGAFYQDWCSVARAWERAKAAGRRGRDVVTPSRPRAPQMTLCDRGAGTPTALHSAGPSVDVHVSHSAARLLFCGVDARQLAPGVAVIAPSAQGESGEAHTRVVSSCLHTCCRTVTWPHRQDPRHGVLHMPRAALPLPAPSP